MKKKHKQNENIFKHKINIEWNLNKMYYVCVCECVSLLYILWLNAFLNVA